MAIILKQKNRGFTLTEIIFACAIFSIVLAMIYAFYFSELDLWSTINAEVDLRAETRNALNFMVSELQLATRTSDQNPSPNLDIPSAPNNKSIHFYLPQMDGNGVVVDANGDTVWDKNNPILYQYVPGQRQLRRLEKGEHQILANDVENVEFCDINIDPELSIYEIRITLTVNKVTQRGRNIRDTLGSIVRLRN